jgi:ankyrin repeat protein
MDPFVNNNEDVADTLLNYVLLDDNKKVVELIKSTVDVNMLNCMGTTALHHAASINSISMVRLLLENGAKSMQDSTGKFPEDWASDPGVIKSLQEKKNFAISSI